ncbi:hypothetical protein LEN26_009749 [Aphanomyces euteiches]|nr:hypothetical protein AeMF1_012091 [Aphanomyces euteiches]KAH9124272.1 hypothetical protein LEN26_009749 [Aphanomyces euteiches]KAH9184425.1 hypothetical protein AeNC1_013597 [Aphanomyces euteiches]
MATIHPVSRVTLLFACAAAFLVAVLCLDLNVASHIQWFSMDKDPRRVQATSKQAQGVHVVASQAQMSVNHTLDSVNGSAITTPTPSLQTSNRPPTTTPTL